MNDVFGEKGTVSPKMSRSENEECFKGEGYDFEIDSSVFILPLSNDILPNENTFEDDKKEVLLSTGSRNKDEDMVADKGE